MGTLEILRSTKERFLVAGIFDSVDDEVVFTNFRHDWKGAVLALREAGGGVAVAALHHPDIGDIDLRWGKTSDDPRSKGSGLAKIIKWHPEVMGDLQGFISSLDVRQHHRKKNEIHLSGKDGKGQAGIKLVWNGKTSHWLMTAYLKGVGASKRIPAVLDATFETTAAPSNSTDNFILGFEDFAVNGAIFDDAKQLPIIERLKLTGELAGIKKEAVSLGSGVAASLKKLKVLAKANELRIKLVTSKPTKESADSRRARIFKVETDERIDELDDAISGVETLLRELITKGRGVLGWGERIELTRDFHQKKKERESLISEQNDLLYEDSKKIHLLLFHGFENTKSTMEGAVPKSVMAKIPEVDTFMQKIIHPDRMPLVTVKLTRARRAGYSYLSHTVAVSKEDRKETILHEIAHDIETRHPWVFERARAFILKRADGAKPVSLKKLYPNASYRKDELTYEDSWVEKGGNAYSGKVYKNSTELISTGMERLFLNTRRFAKEDPEFFDELMYILQGEVT